MLTGIFWHESHAHSTLLSEVTMRILVVDDEPLVARTISIILQKRGFSVSVAYSALEALASATSSPPDLVLCDIDMPGRDGVALMEDLGRHGLECPILVLTGSFFSIDRAALCAQSLRQPVRILSKPCPPVLLLQEADLLLRNAHSPTS